MICTSFTKVGVPCVNIHTGLLLSFQNGWLIFLFPLMWVIDQFASHIERIVVPLRRIRGGGHGDQQAHKSDQ